MAMHKLTSFLLFLFVLPIPVVAQHDSSGEQLEAMQKLNFLLGDWEGTGWIARGPGPRHHFVQTETIRPYLNGDLILIEGRGVAAEDTTQVIHHAIAFIGYDADQERYVMRSFLAGGRTTPATVDVQDKRLTWQMGNNVRYTIWLNEKGQWDEVGEYSQDGENWTQFFAMTLDRVE